MKNVKTDAMVLKGQLGRRLNLGVYHKIANVAKVFTPINKMSQSENWLAFAASYPHLSRIRAQLDKKINELFVASQKRLFNR